MSEEEVFVIVASVFIFIILLPLVFFIGFCIFMRFKKKQIMKEFNLTEDEFNWHLRNTK
jgi:uncharacterized protein YneF (UPF0154 family)